MKVRGKFLIVDKQNSGKEILLRLLRNHIRPYVKSILLAIFFMIIAAACSAIIVKLVEPTINQIFLTHDQHMLVILPLAIIAIYSIKGIAEYYQSYLIKYIGQKILTDLQIKMYEHLLFADLSFIQSQSSGRLISRFTNDISLMRGAVSNLLVGCAKHLLTVIFLIILMFNLEPVLSSVVFLVFPLAIYPIQKLGKRMRKVSSQVQEELGNYTAKLDETFQSIKVIKSFSAEKVETIRAQTITQNLLEFYKKAAKLDALTSPIMEILCGIVAAGIVWYSGILMIDNRTTPGALIAFISAFVTAYRPFKSLVSLNINLQEGITAAKRVFYVLDIKPIVEDSIDATDVNFINPDIIFDEVSLKFGKKTAIKSVYLKLEKGKTTALVGRSGSGKTSLANLLVRFYDPNEGQVLINNHDIRKVTIASLRQQIALVTQDTILFDATVAENIAYGKPGSSLERIIEAAKLADANEFILNLPQGYDTIVGAQGSTLSGGQRQRLSIARAFLKDAPILILDEATSALDLSSEQSILNSLNSLRQNKIILIITHRLSSIRWVDNIVVMKAGQIIEQGTHEKLLEKKSEYSLLYNKELKEIELE